MPTNVTREEVQALMSQGCHVVDVLPRREYADEHLAGAENVPLKELTADTTAHLRKDEAVIVYCHDLL